jgi:hypothetical protein
VQHGGDDCAEHGDAEQPGQPVPGVKGTHGMG